MSLPSPFGALPSLPTPSPPTQPLCCQSPRPRPCALLRRSLAGQFPNPSSRLLPSSTPTKNQGKGSPFLLEHMRPPCKAGVFAGSGGGPESWRSICHLPEILSTICRIEADATLSDLDKALVRQELLGGIVHKAVVGDGDGDDEYGKSAFCMKHPKRPVTTPSFHDAEMMWIKKWMMRICALARWQ